MPISASFIHTMLPRELFPPEKSQEEIRLMVDRKRIEYVLSCCFSRVKSITELFVERRNEDVFVLLKSLSRDIKSLQEEVSCDRNFPSIMSTRFRTLAAFSEENDAAGQSASLVEVAEIVDSLPRFIVEINRFVRENHKAFKRTATEKYKIRILKYCVAVSMLCFSATCAAFLSYYLCKTYVADAISKYRDQRAAMPLSFDLNSGIVPSGFKLGGFGLVESDENGVPFVWGEGPRSLIVFNDSGNKKMTLSFKVAAPVKDQFIKLLINNGNEIDIVAEHSEQPPPSEKVIEFISKRGVNAVEFRYSNWNMKHSQLFYQEQRQLAARFYSLSLVEDIK